MGHCHAIDAQCLSIVRDGTPSETPTLRGKVVPGECRGEKMRAEGKGSAKTGVTTRTDPSQVSTSKIQNCVVPKNSPVNVHHQRPKDEIREWLSQGSLSLSVQHSVFGKEWTQRRGVRQRAGVEKLLLQGLK